VVAARIIPGSRTSLRADGGQPVKGKVDVSTLGGNDMGSLYPVLAWNFELKPGIYTVRATANGLACEPVTA
jgi:hypothetical protein